MGGPYHTARTDSRDDLIRTEARTGSQGHRTFNRFYFMLLRDALRGLGN